MWTHQIFSFSWQRWGQEVKSKENLCWKHSHCCSPLFPFSSIKWQVAAHWPRGRAICLTGSSYLSPAAQQGLQAGPEGTGRTPKHLCSGIMNPRNPATMSTHSALVLKAGLRETRLLGWLLFRAVGRYLTGRYMRFKQTTTEYVTASASSNSCRAAACKAQAWGKSKSPINSLGKGTRPQLQTRATATLSDRVQSEPAKEQSSKKGETFCPTRPVQNSSPGRKCQGFFCKDRSSLLA